MRDEDHPEMEMLREPLTTAEGFLNPACMNELEAALNDAPKTHERLANDPEWSERKDKWIFRKNIVAAFAASACGASPYGVPDGLENVCKYLYASLASVSKWETAGMTEASLCDINRWLYEILYEQGVKEFDAWNQCKVGDTPNISFTSRFDGEKDPDHDFIDLDALLHQTCIFIRNERREFDRFNRDFEERYGSSPEVSTEGGDSRSDSPQDPD